VSDRWARGLPIFEWNRESSLIAGLGLLAALTVPFSIWPGGSLAVLFDYAKTATIFFLLSHVVTTLSRLRLAAWLLTWMAIGLGLFALYNSLTGAVIDQGANQDRLVGNEGALTKNPNDLALMVWASSCSSISGNFAVGGNGRFSMPGSSPHSWLFLYCPLPMLTE
jgi:hypothetical protein